MHCAPHTCKRRSESFSVPAPISPARSLKCPAPRSHSRRRQDRKETPVEPQRDAFQVHSQTLPTSTWQRRRTTPACHPASPNRANFHEKLSTRPLKLVRFQCYPPKRRGPKFSGHRAVPSLQPGHPAPPPLPAPHAALRLITLTPTQPAPAKQVRLPDKCASRRNQTRTIIGTESVILPTLVP